MAVSGCFICSKFPKLFMASVHVTDAGIGSLWTQVYGTTKWALVPDIDEAESLVTSETDGVKVKPCTDVIEWSLENRSALCDTAGNWLFQHFMDPADITNPAEYWFYATWKQDATEATMDVDFPVAIGPVDSTDNQADGFLIRGTPNIGGMEIDGANAGQAAETEWTVSAVQTFFPNLPLLTYPAA